MSVDLVKVRIVDEYKMPSICCACGEPAGRARFKVYASTWASRRVFSVAFPLCPACEQAYDVVDRRRRVGCWAGLGVALVVAVVGILSETLAWGAGLSSGWTFLLFFGALLAGLAVFFGLPRVLSRHLREPYLRVLQAVRIKDYSPSGLLGGAGVMVLLFAHAPFASAFCQENDRLIVS
jgi:hypothetical protein